MTKVPFPNLRLWPGSTPPTLMACMDFDDWHRLKALNPYSQERRRERCLIIFVWKLAMGLVLGYRKKFRTNPQSLAARGQPLPIVYSNRSQ